MNAKTRAKLIVGGVVVVALAACLLAIRLANRSLTAAGARRLPCADGDYAWVSNNEIITFLTKHATVPARYDPSVQKSVVDVTAEETDIASGNRAMLSEFHSRLLDEYSSDIAHWCVSPDGKRLVFGPDVGSPDYNVDTAPLSVWTFASDDAESIDDEVYVGINYSVRSIVWMPDSRLLLIANGDRDTLAALYNTESDDDSSVAIPLAVPGLTAIGVTPDNHLIYSDFVDAHTGAISIFDQEIYPAQAALHKSTPKLPDGVTVKGISLSPQGDRLAWLTSSIYIPPGYRFMKKNAPWLARRIAPYPVISIYASQVDGTGMRLLGMENNPPNAPDEVVRNVRWRPDGKFLSFRWRRGVYLVPAD